MSATTVVSWEWFFSWGPALEAYYPRFTAQSQITGIFTVDVPFMIPIAQFGGETYLVLNGSSDVVVFRPREWRGTATSGIPPFSQDFYLTPAQMAAEVNGYAPGTVAHIYLTSDGGPRLRDRLVGYSRAARGGAGGANLDSLYSLVGGLDEHVSVVGPNQLVDLALQRNAYLHRAAGKP